MKEEWRRIGEFPNYSVSSNGLVRNDETGRLMVRHLNQRGIPNVGLTRTKMQYRRSVSVLVATAFITTARSLAFDTPINRDGDRLNCQVNNLAWRPRWYATEYFQQFPTVGPGVNKAIEEMKTREVFKTSWDAALNFGLLDKDIVDAIVHHTCTRLTYQTFRVVL
jgi:hypothetical protein